MGFDHDEGADIAIAEHAEGLAVVGAGAGLEIDEEDEVVGGGLFVGVGDREAAGGVDGDGFGEEDVFACCNRVIGLARVEVGWGFDDDGVD